MKLALASPGGQQKPDTYLELSLRREKVRVRWGLLEGQKPFRSLAIIIEKPLREKAVLNAIKILF